MGLEDGAGDFEKVVDEVKQLAMTDHDRKTLIIDGFTKLFNNCVRDRQTELERQGKEIAYGNERKPALNWTRKLLRWLEQCDMNIVLICHSAVDYSDEDKAGIKPDCPKDCLFDLNLVLECFRQGPHRKARVIKSRYEQFNESEIFELSYDAFSAKWQAKVEVAA